MSEYEPKPFMSEPADPAFKDVKVMLVDDDSFLLGIYALRFQKKGFAVDACLGSVEALKKIREGAYPDILLLDVIMPFMTGIDMLRILREEKLCEGSVVIMLTNQNLSPDIKAAEELGVEGYIVKASCIPTEVVAHVVKIWSEHKDKKQKVLAAKNA